MHEVIKEHAKGRTVKVVANLPYYITTPIIMMLLESHLPIESVTVMVQKEVADRMAAGPGNKQYGAITASMNYYCTTSLVVDVPHNCFMPEPNVESAVIKLDIYKEPPVSVTNEKQLFRIMKASFSQRRKTLLNTLASNGELGLPKEEIKEMLDNSGIGAKTRGETLSLQEFAMLSDYIDEHRKQD